MATIGKFNGKITAEFTPPSTWVLEKPLSFATAQLNNDDVDVLKRIGANIRQDLNGAKVTCVKGMETDLASVPRIIWTVLAPWDVARAAVIHDHLYASLRRYYNRSIFGGSDRKIWRKGRELSDKIFLLGMKSAEPSVPAYKMYPAYWAVRVFGRWPASAKES